jgi:hypothetical protein
MVFNEVSIRNITEASGLIQAESVISPVITPLRKPHSCRSPWENETGGRTGGSRRFQLRGVHPRQNPKVIIFALYPHPEYGINEE